MSRCCWRTSRRFSNERLPARWPTVTMTCRGAPVCAPEDRPTDTHIAGRRRWGVSAVKVKMILPALTEATSPFWRPIKYSLFPPLGLATLAGYLDDDADVEIQDEHVETLDVADAPGLVVIQVYITSAK